MLRVATDTDKQALYDIYSDSEVNKYLAFEIVKFSEFEPLFKELMQQGDLMVMEQDDKIVATCIVSRGTHRQSHIMRI